jgi:predicted MarR family transcription regulator
VFKNHLGDATGAAANGGEAVVRGKKKSENSPMQIAAGDGGGKRQVDPRAMPMTQFELALVVVYNAFSQWTVRCGTAVGAGRFSSLDLLVIGFLNAHDQTVRAADISFALKIEDTYTVQYALKKLLAADIVESRRLGKETLFAMTDKGRALYRDYSVVRSKFLLDAMAMLSKDGLDMDGLVSRLRAISGIYEQAARNAASVNFADDIGER